MRDPYSVLGVSRNATNDEIKKAYRALCRKYHPDANINNPNKAQAEEVFKEVGEAYSRIMDERSGKTAQEPFGTNAQSSSYSDSDSHLRAASAYIQSGYYKEAITVLNSVTERSAMWYYLSAVANSRLGNNIIAREHAKQAAAMEPDNRMYQNLANAMSGGTQFYQDYRQQGANYGRTYTTDFSYCNNACVKCCAANILLNLCCNAWRC